MRTQKQKDIMQDRSAVVHTAGLSQFMDRQDCFGKEYDNTTTECRYCASNEICALWQIKTNKIKADKLRPLTPDGLGNYLGEARPELLTVDTLRQILTKPMSVSDVVERLRKKTQIDDDSILMDFLKETKRNTANFVQYEQVTDGETDYFVKFV